MLAYILRRLLLMVPTLIGVVTLTFVVTQFVPGGPVEQVMTQLRHGKGRGGEAGAGGGGYHGSQGVDPQQLEQIKKQFGFDKPPLDALRHDAQELRDLQSRAVVLPASKRVGGDQIEAAGVDHARLMDGDAHLPDIGAVGHCESSAQRLPLRHGHQRAGALRLRDPGFRAGRAAADAVRRRHASGRCSRCAVSPRTTSTS
jgi:hypothetical protein